MPRHNCDWRLVWCTWCAALAASGAWTSPAAWAAEPIQRIGELKLQGQWDESTAISGIALSEDHKLLFLAADESGGVYVFKSTADPLSYSWAGTIDVRVGTSHADDEADIEGLAVSGPWLYVIGSHSKKRQRVKPETETRATNRERHFEVKAEKGRRVLVRLRAKNALDPDAEIERVNLWPRFESNELLNRFTQIPSKENGLDIEGLAVDGDRLLLGFRSPVLRDGYALAMETAFDNDAEANLKFLGLGGHGIRDLTHLKAGRLLVLGGPSGEVGADYSLSLWNGKDTTPGNDGPTDGRLIPLGTVPLPVGPAGKAEGIAVFRQSPSSLDVVVVYDGLAGGGPTVFRCPLPSVDSDF